LKNKSILYSIKKKTALLDMFYLKMQRLVTWTF